VIERSGDMTLATTISLASLRGPVPLAKTLAAVDLLSGGRLVAGVGPESSKRDYDALGVSYKDRWKRFDEAVMIMRAQLRDEPVPISQTTSRCQTHRSRQHHEERTASLSGSEAGGPPPGFGASPGSVTGGWLPDTTRRPKSSRPPAGRWPSSLPAKGRALPSSRTPW
jgi:alkanesulfonate monooxygenase SsuD/methylene tetrahydromethanopterin reductase-like flavin-dependent oxidoreductase (luciferase family)